MPVLLVGGDIMDKIIDYRDVKDNWIFVDLRSPAEHQEFTIPDSVNIPLLNDEERKEIGTIYKQESIEKAKKLGVEAVSKKLPDIYNQMLDLKKRYGNIVVFCARGGMRSGSICSLFNSLGLNIWQLRGGYKGYRSVVNEELPKLHTEVNYIVLHGFTGAGKTAILHQIAQAGLDILDLEGAANNRGSLFGSVGLGEKRSQKQFETLVYNQLEKRKTNNVFVEAESKRIGNIIMPEYIYSSLMRGRHILVEASLEVRAQRIVQEYIQGPDSQGEILKAFGKLRSYLNEKIIQRLVELVREEKYLEVAKELLERYYDPMYQHKQKDYQYDLIVNSNDLDEACREIVSWTKEKIEKK